MSCKDFESQLAELVAGTISPSDRDALVRHAQTCADCRRALADHERLRGTLQEAFAPATPAWQAAVAILQRLPAAPPAPLRNVRLASLFAPAWRGLAAAVLLLAVGSLGGFALGRLRAATTAPPSTGRLPVRIASVSGTVLVKHAHQADWHDLSPTSAMYLGDVVHATGASAATLSLWNQSTIDLAANTTLSADAFDGRVEFSLCSGTIKARLESAHPSFFIRTPQGVLEALGTEFTVSVQ